MTRDIQDAATVTLDGTEYELTLDSDGSIEVEKNVNEIQEAIENYAENHPTVDSLHYGIGSGPELGATVIFECTLTNGIPGHTHVGRSRRTDAAEHLKNAGIGLELDSFEEESGEENVFLLHATIVDEDHDDIRDRTL